MYIFGPLALRMPIPARRLDYWAGAFFTIGTAGMVSHFWTESFSGMTWSAALVVLGFDKVFHFLPGYVLSNVYAHAHLAAVGWALMMVAGVGYRMLPMVLPSAILEGKSVYLSAVLLEIGVVGLFITLVSGSGWVPFFTLVSAGGVAAFLGHVAWMRRHSRPGPAALPRPDYGVWHTVQALIYLALATAFGVALVVLPLSEATLRVVLPLRGVRLGRLSRADGRRHRVAPASSLCLVRRGREPRSPRAARLTAPDA